MDLQVTCHPVMTVYLLPPTAQISLFLKLWLWPCFGLKGTFLNPYNTLCSQVAQCHEMD